MFDNQLSIFQPTEKIAQVFKTFIFKNTSQLFTTSSRDSDNLFRIPLALLQLVTIKKCCLTTYFTTRIDNLRDAVLS